MSGYDRNYNNYPNDLRDTYDPYRDPYQTNDPRQYNPPPYYSTTTAEPYVAKYDHIGDFTPFYIAITFCAIIGISLFILNIVLGCCSSYSEYWKDRHTGNRWIVSLWTATPHKQPPLDHTTELQEISSKNHVVYYHPQVEEHPEGSELLEVRSELRSARESEI
ncbi:uncharacterized protein LOC126750094 [Anthonomus grandis grandis]|uniref:uncharacterized protein LOC126750094 n=1 Tax=Anthonomus grandis grandis TaxID=2921223 RepID=UPI0021660343|nr:uncharacterized protein LOC126750094 [Anthonomus grandis grandis]